MSPIRRSISRHGWGAWSSNSASALALDVDAAQVWGRLRVANPDHALDTQIAAIALVNDLTLATRNVADFQGLGVRLRNPFVRERRSE